MGDVDMRRLVGRALTEALRAEWRRDDDAIEDVVLHGWDGASEASRARAIAAGFRRPGREGVLVLRDGSEIAI